MRKVIAIVSQDPIIQAKVDAIAALDALKEQRLKFLAKSIKDIEEKTHKNQSKHWEEIEFRLGELNLYPKEYDKEKHVLCCSKEQNIIAMEERPTGSSLLDFLKNTFS